MIFISGLKMNLSLNLNQIFFENHKFKAATAEGGGLRKTLRDRLDVC